MYDLTKLKTIEECRIVMQRAKASGLADVYAAVFKRMCTLLGLANEDHDDPLVREFFETLAAYEQVLTEKNGRKTSASRTRQKVANKGVYQSLVDWTLGSGESEGFKLLVAAGMPEYTGEHLVTRFSDRFPSDVVEAARARLRGHGIPLPESAGN